MATEPEGTTRVSDAEMANLCRQFATLMTAQVNILDIFATLREGTENDYLRGVLYSVQEAVEMGRSLASAFGQYPDSFSPFFVSMLRQGELEGELDRVLTELAEHYEGKVGAAEEGPRRAEALAVGEATLVSAVQQVLAWLLWVVAAALLGAGLAYYLTSLHILPGSPTPNILLAVGVAALGGALLFTLGRSRR